MAQLQEKKLELVRNKVTKAGKYYEVRYYQLPYVRGYTAPDRPKPTRKPNPERRSDSISRARNSLLRRVLANSEKTKPLFITLTYVENMESRVQAIEDTKSFIESLRIIYGKIDWLYVLERQERGAWHVHLLIFNRNYMDIKCLRSVWQETIGQGARVNIKKTNDAKHVGFYLGKYLGKEERLPYQRAYTLSRGLLTHEEFTNYLWKNDVILPKKCIYSGGYFTPRGDFVNIDIYYDES